MKRAATPRRGPNFHVTGGEELDAAAGDAASESYVFRLYVTGTTPRSLRAVSNLTRLCDELLVGRSTIEIVDLYEDPDAARSNSILAAPTLEIISDRRRAGQRATSSRILGDLSDRERLVAALTIVREA